MNFVDDKGRVVMIAWIESSSKTMDCSFPGCPSSSLSHMFRFLQFDHHFGDVLSPLQTVALSEVEVLGFIPLSVFFGIIRSYACLRYGVPEILTGNVTAVPILYFILTIL